MKAENILFSSDFTIKIADFGFTTLTEGKNKNGILFTKLGTEGYMAP
jgi:serine/threonine protein kinase